MWKKIYKHLKSKGFDVYSPAQHEGVCTEPYIVLRNAGELNKDSHSNGIYDISVYFPKGKYSKLEDYRLSLVKVLSELDYLKKTGLETPVIYEDEIKAYSFSIQYILMKAKGGI